MTKTKTTNTRAMTAIARATGGLTRREAIGAGLGLAAALTTFPAAAATLVKGADVSWVLLVLMSSAALSAEARVHATTAAPATTGASTAS